MSYDTEYLAMQVQKIKGLKSPSDAQKAILEIAERADFSTVDKKNLAVLLRAEKASDRLRDARAKTAKVLNKAKEAERKARTKRLILLGAWVEQSFENGTLDKQAVYAQLRETTKRDADRKALGFEPLPKD